MENKPTFGNGKICYVLIPASNIEESAEFYRKVFGWHIRKRPDGSVSFDDGVGEVSGEWISGLKPAVQMGLFISIMVDDAVATLELITANGGKITQPIRNNTPDITAHFSDPFGNILGIFQHGGRG
jgi:uncharacterized protein